MKFIKLESFWKDTNAWLVNVNDIIFVVDKGDYRDVTIKIPGDANNKELRVKNTIDEIMVAIENHNTEKKNE